MSNLRIIFFGTPDFVNPILTTIQENGWLVGVVTAPNKPVGRTQEITPSKVAVVAQEFKVPILKPEKLTDITRQLRKLKPDLYIVAAYGKIISQNILNIPKFGALNIHPSLLPKYRGASPIQNSILNGDELSGVSIIQMDVEIDHGPLVFTTEIRLSKQDNFDTLSKKMFKETATVLPDIITNFIGGKLVVKEQNHKLATFTKIIKKEDSYFHIDNPPSKKKLNRMIRAFYPWPTVWTRWNGKVVKFYPKSLIQMEGKKPVPLKDFLNGYPNFPLKSLT